MTVPVWKLNAVQVLGFACFGLAAGIWLKRKFPVLDRLNIPAAIVGGMMFALLALSSVVGRLNDRNRRLERSHDRIDVEADACPR